MKLISVVLLLTRKVEGEIGVPHRSDFSIKLTHSDLIRFERLRKYSELCDLFVKTEQLHKMTGDRGMYGLWSFQMRHTD